VVEVDLGNALVAGAIAGVVSGAPSTLLTLWARGDVLASSAAAGTIVVPDDAPRPVQLAAGAAVHGAISLGWAVVLAGALPRRPGVVAGAAAGAAAGVGIAALDLGLLARRFPAIRALAPVPQVLDHVAYGVTVAMVLSWLRSRPAPGRA
jgi:hypothetical protein